MKLVEVAEASLLHTERYLIGDQGRNGKKNRML